MPEFHTVAPPIHSTPGVVCSPWDPKHIKHPRGGRRSPAHLLAALPRHVPVGVTPPLNYWLPKVMTMLGNDVDGDCHDGQTEVLTDDGWMRWSEYDGKSLLGTVNQSTLLLEFQAPTSIIRRQHDGPMAYGTHKGQDFAITPNHRFLLRDYKIAKKDGEYAPEASGYGAYEFRMAGDAPARFLIPGAPSGFIGTRLDKLTIGSRQWDGSDLLRFLSLIISDGYASSGATHPERSSFCCFREDRLDMVRAFAYKLGMREEKSCPGVWVLEDAAMNRWLRMNIYVGDVHRSPFKKVPDLIKVASQDQIEEFLRFYGDQGFSNGRNFWTSSPYLADDLQELLMRTGKRANITKREPRPGRETKDGKWIESLHPSFALHVWEDSDVGMLGPKNKKATMTFAHYKGEVFCATVPNSTLITRRNGSVLISGNCVTAGAGFFQQTRGILISDATCIAWASKNGVLNGADLTQVNTLMQTAGFQQDGNTYNEAPANNVDFTSDAAIQSALSVSPVQIAIDANALPSGAGNGNGWYAFGGTPGSFPNTDHCVVLTLFAIPASVQQMIAAFMSQYSGVGAIPWPSGPVYGLYTWAGIGFVDLPWLQSTCTEAHGYTPPVSVIVGTSTPTPDAVLTPTPGPGPTPVPTPPNPPTPVPGTLTLPSTITLNADGTWAQGTAFSVDMGKLPDLIVAMLAFLGVPPQTRFQFEQEWKRQVISKPPGTFNWTKLIQVGALVIGWVTTGMNPATLPALITQIIAIITGP